MNRRLRPNIRLLKWAAIILPILFWMVILFLRTSLFGETRPFEGDVFALAMIALGAFLFSTWVFRIIDERELEIKRRSDQLAALHEADLMLTTELDLGVVLQKVVDLARSLVGAKYGALGVLDAKGETIEQFITSGLAPEERARIGDPPHGRGLLGTLITEGKPIRIPEIAEDKRSVGFPPHHPPMTSLLGIPVISKGKVIGDLYLTDKLHPRGEGADTVFNDQDQEIVEMFATQVAVAIENAQLYRQTRQLAILQERERFGMDLHDGIIQSIYGIGLQLEDGEHWIDAEPEMARERFAQAIHGLNDVIRDIRNYILDLRPQRFQGRNLKRGLEELARDLRANTFLNVKLTTDSADTSSLTPEQTVEILHVVQEALTNVRKHARAINVAIDLQRMDKQLQLTIGDDGVGLNVNRAEQAGGNGLRNMRERVRGVGGEIEIEPRKPLGTQIILKIPMQ